MVHVDPTHWQERFHRHLAARLHSVAMAERLADAVAPFLSFLSNVGHHDGADGLCASCVQSYRDHAIGLEYPDPDWTAEHQLLAVRAFLHYLSGEPAGPADLVMGSASTPPRSDTSLSALEVEALLLVPDIGTPMGRRDRAMLELLYTAGLDGLEVRQLRLEAVDLETARVRVLRPDGHCHSLPLEVSHYWLQPWLEEDRHRFVRHPVEPAVFVTADGRPLDAAAVESVVRLAARTMGIDKAVDAATLHRVGCARRRPAFRRAAG